MTDAFRALKDRIPNILSFEQGVNDSPEGRNLGFTHVYLLTFTDAASRDRYLPPGAPEVRRATRPAGGARGRVRSGLRAQALRHRTRRPIR
ncbi:MAG: Dabb family protein [Gemmatimonadetes bacterium]|nr:Dabb family protein [Gemmatimonadota bacterium]